jgi:hypothetical protein
MAEGITVASTTDEMRDVEAAAEASPEELESGRLPEPEASEEEELEAEPESEPEPEPRRRNPVQRRIDSLTREKYESRARIQELEAKLREVEQSTRPSAEPPTPVEKAPELAKPEEPTRPPDPEAERVESARRQVQQRFSQHYEALYPKGSPQRAELERAAAKTQVEVGGIDTTVAEIVMSMPNAIDVYSHLCTHPDDLRVLNASHSSAEAVASVRYISGALWGIAEGRTSAQPKPRPSIKRPPAPADRLKGGGSPSSPSLEDADYQTYRRMREQHEKNRYR